MQAEKLNLWDRLFNRYRKEIVEQGEENWDKFYGRSYYYCAGQKIPNSTYVRNFVVYKIIDRLTGSEELQKVYLN